MKRSLPRFYAQSLPRSFGLLLTVACAVPLVITILAMLSDTSVFLILASVLLVLVFAAGMLTGVLAVAASMERLHISSADGVRVCLGRLTLARFPAKTIRSAVASAREYRMRMTDKHIYLMQLFSTDADILHSGCNGPHPRRRRSSAICRMWSCCCSMFKNRRETLETHFFDRSGFLRRWGNARFPQLWGCGREHAARVRVVSGAEDPESCPPWHRQHRQFELPRHDGCPGGGGRAAGGGLDGQGYHHGTLGDRGHRVPEPLPTYPDGFPEEVLAPFRAATGRGVLANAPWSGTEVINVYGDEHVRTGDLIVYTSADSVFQIAAHEDIVPPEKLYEYCRIARNILQGKHGVGRVIARPFIGTSGHYARDEPARFLA